MEGWEYKEQESERESSGGQERKKRTMRETEGQVVDIKNRQNTTISLSCRHVEVMQRFLKST